MRLSTVAGFNFGYILNESFRALAIDVFTKESHNNAGIIYLTIKVGKRILSEAQSIKTFWGMK